MKSLLHKYASRWQQLPARNQRALCTLTVFLAATLFWVLLWAPQRMALKTAERQLEQVLHLKEELLKLSPSNSSARPQLNDQTLAARVTDSAATNNLIIERMDNDEAHRIDLKLGGSLPDLMKWLDELESQGISLQSVQLEVNPQAMVKAGIRIATR